jgi:hypothetical protein
MIIDSHATREPLQEDRRGGRFSGENRPGLWGSSSKEMRMRKDTLREIEDKTLTNQLEDFE